MSKLVAKEYKCFEDIKKIHLDGTEYWNARELAIVLDYAKWENFHKVIKRAMIACENSGSDVLQCFPEVRKTSEIPKRKQIRIKEYDYSQPGYYFITICASEHKCLFSSLVGAAISRPQEQSNPVGADIIRPQLTECGKYIEKSLSEIPKRYKNVSVDKYVIMPNHIHVILVIAEAAENERMISAPTIPQIVGQMKRCVSKQARFSCWQKSYYEHIIRNEQEYQNICEYIENNPLKWELDKYYRDNETEM